MKLKEHEDMAPLKDHWGKKGCLHFLVQLVVICGQILGFDSFGSYQWARAAAPEFHIRQDSDLIYFTLNQDLKLSAPVLTSNSEEQYIEHIFRTLLREAVDEAQGRFQASGERVAYWSLIVGSLVFLHHESRLQHFRRLEVLGQRCHHEINNGEFFKDFDDQRRKSNPGRNVIPIYPVIEESLLKSEVLNDCDKLSKKDPVYQLLGSYDRLSAGINQFTFTYFPDFFLNQSFTSIQKSIREGIRLYASAFEPLFRARRNQYPCLWTRNARGDLVRNYKNLIRASWAGRYNSGNMAKSCRFTQTPHDKWVLQNDLPFLNVLDDILDIQNGKNLYRVFLDNDDLNAFRQVIRNFLENEDQTEYVNLLAKKDISDKDRVFFGLPETPLRVDQVSAALGQDEDAWCLWSLCVNPFPKEKKTEYQSLQPLQALQVSILRKWTTVPGLNARTYPDTKKGVSIVQFLKGVELEVVRENGAWTEIKIPESMLKYMSPEAFQGTKPGASLYVWSGYLSSYNVNLLKTATVNGIRPSSRLNVRKSPPNGNIVETKGPGDKVQIIRWKYLRPNVDKNPWYEIFPSQPGVERWVYGGYLRMQKDVDVQ